MWGAFVGTLDERVPSSLNIPKERRKGRLDWHCPVKSANERPISVPTGACAGGRKAACGLAKGSRMRLPARRRMRRLWEGRMRPSFIGPRDQEPSLARTQ